MTTPFDPLENLTACIDDVLSEDNVSPDKILTAIRTSIGESVAYHKKMADKGQRVLDGLNDKGAVFGAPPSPDLLYNMNNDVPHVNFGAPEYWGYGAADTISPGAAQDTISFTSSSANDTISLT